MEIRGWPGRSKPATSTCRSNPWRFVTPDSRHTVCSGMWEITLASILTTGFTTMSPRSLGSRPGSSKHRSKQVLPLREHLASQLRARDVRRRELGGPVERLAGLDDRAGRGEVAHGLFVGRQPRIKLRQLQLFKIEIVVAGSTRVAIAQRTSTGSLGLMSSSTTT